MIKVKNYLLTSLLLSLCFMTMDAKVVYVKSGSVGDGSTWENAYGKLQDAIDAAQTGDEIWIAEGVYKPETLIKSSKKNSRAFILKDGVSLYGGFIGNENSKDERIIQELSPIDNYPVLFAKATILDADDDVEDVWQREMQQGSTYRYSWTLENDQVVGTNNNSNHVLYCADEIVDGIEINGLTLKGANAREWKVKAAGGALYAKGNVKLTNCVITENQAWFKVESMSCSDTFGGAVYIDGGDKAEISNCLFYNNYSHSSYGNGYGGAVYAKNVKISNCAFKDCVGLDGGGAIFNIGGSISNCRFEDCYASAGGAVYNNDGLFEHNVIYNCRALIGGGLANKGTARYSVIAGCYADAEEFGEDSGKGGGVWNEYGDLSGCVIYNNHASLGGGVVVKDGRIINCTIQNNTTRKETGNVNIADVSLTENIKAFNTIGDNGDAEASNFVNPTSFKGNATTDEQKLEIENADWRLSEGSEFIDSGEEVAGFVENNDIDGNERIMGKAIDKGAYETEAQKELVPCMVITFDEADKQIKIGIGGQTGDPFSIDWGDGEMKEYNAAKYYKGIVKGNVMKVYGEGVQVLYAQGLGITDLDITNAPNLTKVLLGQNLLKSLDVHNNVNLRGLYCESNKLESLDVSNNKEITVVDCSDNQIYGKIDCSVMKNLSKVDCSYNHVSELILPHHSTVYEVSCSNNNISKLDLSGLTGLDQLNCHDNMLDSLIVDDLLNATEISAYANNLTSVDVSACKALKTLSLAENKIKNIDLSKNINLQGLYLFDNELTSLDITNNSDIRWLNVENNNIQGMFDTFAQSMLSLIIANGNNIDNVNLENNKNCMQVQMANNNLNDIDVSMLGSLSWLKIDGNNISSLDVSSNDYLYWLECGNNNLETLDVSKNKYVQRLEAQDNNISKLMVPAGNAYEGVKLQNNNLGAEELNDLIGKLKDVNGVEINENNEEWGKVLDISNMPGTFGADIAAAEEKGWTVIADIPTSIDETFENAGIVRIIYYSIDGKVIDRITEPGIYVVKYVYGDGNTKTEKLIIK